MPGDEFDPLDGLDEEDKAYLQGHREAFAKQKAIHSKFSAGDEERRKAAEEHMRATQAALGVVPAQEAPGQPPSAPVLAPAPAPRPTASGILSILVAVPELPSPGGIPPTTEKYAPDWNVMKDIIAKYDGTWIVTRHEFPANVPDILGFFGKDGWQRPADSEKQKFEAIVKSGRVFKTD